MKKILSIILTLTLSATVFAQPLPKKLEHNEKMAWWRNAKFGMSCTGDLTACTAAYTTDSTKDEAVRNGL